MNEVLAEFINKEMMIANVIDRQISFTRDYHKLGAMAPVWQNVAEIIEWTKQSLLVRNITIRAEFSDLEVFSDPLLEKVFYNIMDNALRYGGEKMTTIRFSLREEGDSLIICCEDDGIGIDEENKDLIFNRGYAHNTGLGLFLSREILGITEMTITETGIFGKGARFEIRVPKGSFRFNDYREGLLIRQFIPHHRLGSPGDKRLIAGARHPWFRLPSRQYHRSFAQSISAEYTLISITGVPSMASSPRTFRTPSFTSSRSTIQSETGFGRSGDRMANTPFLGRCPGRDCPENCPVSPVEPAEDPEVLPPLDLPEGGTVFFINHDLGDGIGQTPLPGCIALCLVGGADGTDGMELDGCGCHQ